MIEFSNKISQSLFMKNWNIRVFFKNPFQIVYKLNLV